MGIERKWYSQEKKKMEYVWVSVREGSQSEGFKPKVTGRRPKLRIGVYYQGVLKQKGVKEVGQ
jgi:hypothetical protein